jgi:streptomycin 6-kinase
VAANGKESKGGRGAADIHWGEGEGAARVLEERGALIHRIEINGSNSLSPLSSRP